MLGSLEQEVLLELDDGNGDILDGSLSLLERLDEPLGRLDLLAQEGAGLSVAFGVSERGASGSADLELGEGIIEHADLQVAVDLFHQHVRSDIHGLFRLHALSRHRIE